MLVRTIFPSGASIDNIYVGSQLRRIVTPEGTTDYTYYCGTNVEFITRGDEQFYFEYDGSLLTSIAQIGTLNEIIVSDHGV